MAPGAGWGIVAGLSAAIVYTFANIALRSVIDVDPFLVSAVKAFPTVLMLAPVIFFFNRRTSSTHQRLVQDASHLSELKWRFVGVAMVGQVIGNGAFQVALGYIGLAASVPITLGCLLIGSAVLGRILLSEPVRPRVILAMIVLLTAVVVLSTSKSVDSAAISPSEDVANPLVANSFAWLGGVGAALSGLAFAFFSTMMRRTMQRGLTSVDAMWISGLVGSVALWAIALWRIGFEPIAQVTPTQWWWMLAAGLFNFIGFVAISTALRVLPVVAVHLLNATQVAMAALAAVVVFQEKWTLGLSCGISLTIGGLLILVSGKRMNTAPDQKPLPDAAQQHG